MMNRGPTKLVVPKAEQERIEREKQDPPVELTGEELKANAEAKMGELEEKWCHLCTYRRIVPQEVGWNGWIDKPYCLKNRLHLDYVIRILLDDKTGRWRFLGFHDSEPWCPCLKFERTTKPVDPQEPVGNVDPVHDFGIGEKCRVCGEEFGKNGKSWARFNDHLYRGSIIKAPICAACAENRPDEQYLNFKKYSDALLGK